MELGDFLDIAATGRNRTIKEGSKGNERAGLIFRTLWATEICGPYAVCVRSSIKQLLDRASQTP